jgi:hypothetical protein
LSHSIYEKDFSYKSKITIKPLHSIFVAVASLFFVSVGSKLLNFSTDSLKISNLKLSFPLLKFWLVRCDIVQNITNPSAVVGGRAAVIQTLTLESQTIMWVQILRRGEEREGVLINSSLNRRRHLPQFAV